MVMPNNSSGNTELSEIIEMDDIRMNDDPIKGQFNSECFDQLYKIEREKNREVNTSFLKFSEIFSTKNKYYLMMECYSQGIEYQKMLVRDFIGILTSYMQSRAEELDFLGEYDISCYYLRKSNNSIGKVFIELSDKRAVLRENLPGIKSSDMGIPKLTIIMKPYEINCITYKTNNPEIIAFQRLTHRFRIDVDYGNGINVFKNVDDSIEGKINLTLKEADNFKDVCQKLSTDIIDYLSEDGAIRREYNDNDISLNSIGLKTGDEILFRYNPEEVFLVENNKSNSFTRRNGVRYQDEPENTYSLKSVTKRLMRYSDITKKDIFEYWTYKGKTLRAIFEEKKAKWIVPIEFDLDAEYYENNPQLKKNVEN